MAERRNAARLRDLPGSVAPPRDLAGRRPHLPPGARLRTIWLSAAVGVGLVLVVAQSVDLAVDLGRGEGAAVEASAIVRSHLGSGYPGHHGLAGPSQVGPSAGSWLGYPPHFGLAGPSRVTPAAAPLGVGSGYPPHHGLAGPSQVPPAAVPLSVGSGYPPHFGLAGPSQVGDGG